jgi:hypothetical protein
MRAALSLATLLLLIPASPGTAQDWMSPRGTDTATRNWEKGSSGNNREKECATEDRRSVGG